MASPGRCSRLPVLPRPAWLALGALSAALASDGAAQGSVLMASAFTVVALAVLLGALAAVLTRHPAVAALGIGLGSVGLRAAVAALLAAGMPAAGPLPLGDVELSGTVVDIGSPSGIEQRGFVRIGVAADAGPWLVYAWMPRHPALVPGDRVELRGTVQGLPNDDSGFGDFLVSRGAVGTLKAHELELLGSDGGLGALVERLRWGLDDLLSRAVPEPEAGLAAGILIGLRERVSRPVADDFTTTGLTHVVAISGWNIALVAGIATALLRATGLRRRARSIIVLVAIVIYTVLAGAEASVIRAAAMGGVVIAARESGRPSGAAAALALAAWGLLLADPSMISDIGLQLSLAATTGLLVLGGPAERAVRQLTRGRAPRWFCESLGVSLAAQLSTLPLILLHFGRLSVISPLANLFVAPIVPLAMAGAAIAVLLGPLAATAVAPLLAPVGLAAWLPLAMMTRGAAVLAGVPFASVELPPPADLVGAVLALLALIAAWHSVRPPRRRMPVTTSPPAPPAPGATGKRVPAVAALAVVLVAVVSLVLVARPVPTLRVSVLDVGQGDAILLSASDGTRLLVDGGPDPDLLVQRLDERIPLWDRHIDLVVLTHPHEDHAGGLAGLVPRYRIGRVAETGMASDGAGVNSLRDMASGHAIPRVRLVQGDRLRLGATVIDVVWPPLEAVPERAPSTGRAINDTSIVLVATLGQQRVLLTGDLEEDRDHALLEALPQDRRRWDLLKVAHHGSATASSRDLLGVLRPRLAVVSAGIDNRYGHPAPATLERLAAVSARVWRTDRDGTLSFALDGRPRAATALLAGSPRTSACPSPGGPEPPARTGAADACYARPDGGPHPNRSALVAHVNVAVATAPAAHDRGGRGGLVPGLPRHAGGRRRRSPHGRDGRAPP